MCACVANVAVFYKYPAEMIFKFDWHLSKLKLVQLDSLMVFDMFWCSYIDSDSLTELDSQFHKENKADIDKHNYFFVFHRVMMQQFVLILKIHVI